ncbi:MAG: DNA mismatch repair protein MutS [Verrucomicrobia bacterium]|nr:DNA mismatch repair protein MutS [Verrucomicrobiota bacterium]
MKHLQPSSVQRTGGLTPMMQQYHLLRRDLPPDTFLLFRLGDFYEMFFEDAIQAAPILNVSLTKRGETPMCGVPHHALRGYLRKFFKAGKRVALCEQVGEVQTGKLVKREITRILSPGTLEDVGLEEGENNFTATIIPIKPTARKADATEQRRPREGGELLSTDREAIAYGLSYADVSTGEFFVTSLASEEELLNELATVAPAELLAPRRCEEMLKNIKTRWSRLEFLEDYLFDEMGSLEMLRSHFKVQSLDGFGCNDLQGGLIAAGALVHYLTRHLRRDVSHLVSLHPYRHHDYLLIDTATQSHLELVSSRAGSEMTLFSALQRTKTPMGARLLRDWILHPLCETAGIAARQEVIALFLDQPLFLKELRESFAGIRDLERSLSRLSQNSGNARDLGVLGSSLQAVPALRQLLEKIKIASRLEAPLLTRLIAGLHDLKELRMTLEQAIVEEPPVVTKEGGMIRSGFDSMLDELRAAGTEGKEWIANLQEKEIQRTGIKSLKVRFNAVFGYFIEVTKANLSQVPSDYHRKQTTANGERFITPELKEMEGKILGAQERSCALEYEIFQRLRTLVLAELLRIQETAKVAGTLDLLGSLAETARLFDYCRPQLEEGGGFFVKDGRHPVLDQMTREKSFVSNDTNLDVATRRMAIITGPNMAGKSTYLKQVALLTIMAQMGSYVPAKEIRLGLVDRLFTRVGASDDLSRGQSTFMVEMNETANILHNATQRSLVLLDEIGRGTATFDGLSLAWSVAEYLHDVTQARTMFATHYHELPDLARTRSGVINLNVAVRECQDEIIFLHKIVEGAADRSYGIQVARLAGIPPIVVERAKEILANLEKAELNAEGRPQLALREIPFRPRRPRPRQQQEGPMLFDESSF